MFTIPKAILIKIAYLKMYVIYFEYGEKIIVGKVKTSLNYGNPHYLRTLTNWVMKAGWF